MRDRSLSGEVRRLALPAIAHSLLQTLVFVVDRIMLGHHGESSLAAMQLGGALEWSVWSVFAAFEVGTIARVGMHVGAGDRASASRAARVSLVIGGGLGVALGLASPLVVRILPWVARDVSPDAMTEAAGYLGIAMAASPVVFVATTAAAILQGGGDTRTPLVIGVVANIMHVGLNRVFILGLGAVPAMGARGAGISTAVTFLLEAVLAVAILTRPSGVVSLRARAKAVGEPTTSDESSATLGHAAGLREARLLARVALPALLERILYHLGYVGFILIIARLGDAAMAANQSLISVEAICFLSGDGFGIAAAALVAQKLGANRRDDARAATWIATRDAVITLSVFGALAFALRDAILPMFSSAPEVLSLGRHALPLLALAQPFMASAVVLSQALRGAGRTREALVISVVGAFVVRLAATWLFAVTLELGLVGVWLGSTADWFVRSALLVALTVRDGVRARSTTATVSPTLRG